VPPSAARARLILDLLEAQHPDADTELHYRTPFELLVATILSAQSTDQRVNMVTPALFAKYPNAAALARASPAEIEPLIVPTGFFRQKAKILVAMARRLVEAHGGEVPADMDALLKLPGVGRKTANVVLGHAFGVPALPVDRHVLRVANRIGLVKSDDPEEVERQLCRLWPPEEWTRASDTLILHGRRVCRPRPLCDICAVRQECAYYATVVARTASPKSSPKAAAVRRRAPAKPSRPPVAAPPAGRRVAGGVRGRVSPAKRKRR
jgi:endonuclease-3